MIVGLIAFAVFAQNSLLARLVPLPSGKNGYEEYLQAADIASGPQFKLFLSYNPELLAQDGDSSLPGGVTRADSHLSVQKKFVDRFEACLSLIKQGNEKPIWDPHATLTPETQLPELSYFKQLARLESAAVEVGFAYGQNSKAVERLEDGFRFADRISSGPVISRLVGIAASRTMFRQLDRRWQQLSELDADELIQFLSEQLAKPPNLADSFSNEEIYLKGALNQLRSDPSLLKAIENETNDESKETTVSSLWARSSPEQQSIALDRAIAQNDAFFQTIIQGLSGPEQGWLSLASQVDAQDPAARSSLSSMLSSVVMPVLGPTIVAEEAQRTRLRIAYLTLCAIRYRWETGKLPTKIEDFADATESQDPSNGTQFAYRREGDWFRIARVGTDTLGDIRLSPLPQKVESTPTRP